MIPLRAYLSLITSVSPFQDLDAPTRIDRWTFNCATALLTSFPFPHSIPFHFFSFQVSPLPFACYYYNSSSNELRGLHFLGQVLNGLYTSLYPNFAGFIFKRSSNFSFLLKSKKHCFMLNLYQQNIKFENMNYYKV